MARMMLGAASALTFGLLSPFAFAQHTPGDYIQNAICVDGSATLCSQLPVDMPNLAVAFGYNPDTNTVLPSQSGFGTDVRQANFDWFTWQMFVALNWPLNTKTGGPSTTETITSNVTGARVWESYLSVGQVYPGSVAPSKCNTSGVRLVFNSISKQSDGSFTEPFTPYPLIDKDGNYVVYDIRINQREADYISSKGLQTKAGQMSFSGAWDLPKGSGTTPGAMELKTSWRIFPENADTTGYFTVPAVVEVGANNAVSGEHTCINVTAGLIGMHIMQKITNPTKFSDFWVWGTFEHIDNAPLADGATPSAVNGKASAALPYPLGSCPAPANATTYSFFDPSCEVGGQACAPNAPPPQLGSTYLWESTAPYAAKYLLGGQFGTQVTRCWDIYESAQNVTDVYQGAFGSSVWANYQLVGAQWAMSASEGAPSIVPFAAPAYLTNSTLETYLQIEPIGIPPELGQQPGSCIACHNFATSWNGMSSDFSFLARKAQ